MFEILILWTAWYEMIPEMFSYWHSRYTTSLHDKSRVNLWKLRMADWESGFSLRIKNATDVLWTYGTWKRRYCRYEIVRIHISVWGQSMEYSRKLTGVLLINASKIFQQLGAGRQDDNWEAELKLNIKSCHMLIYSNARLCLGRNI